MNDDGQGDLFDAKRPPPPPTIFELFLIFYAEQPIVWKLFRQFSTAAVDRGFAKLGARAVVERVRWDVWFERGPDDDFQINNNHIAFYPRLLMLRDPQRFRGVFELRGGRHVNKTDDATLLRACDRIDRERGQ